MPRTLGASCRYLDGIRLDRGARTARSDVFWTLRAHRSRANPIHQPFRERRIWLRRADISAGEVDYINAHGTSTQLGDEIELKAVERLVGNASADISMSSTKSSIGHLLGAAGTVEAIFCLLAIRDQVVPATINLDNPSVATALDLVPHKPRKRSVNIVLSNSFGFGGTNASLVFRRMTD